MAMTAPVPAPLELRVDESSLTAKAGYGDRYCSPFVGASSPVPA